MRKLIAYSFIFIYLFSLPVMREIAKFPLLIEHFWEHREQSPKMSFCDFVDMHYFSENQKYADYDKDMQLPFKSQKLCPYIEIVFDNQLFDLINNSIIEQGDKNFSYIEDYTISNLPLIFHPPKVI